MEGGDADIAWLALMLAVVALLLLAPLVHLFIVTRVGQDASCGRVGVCIVVDR